MDDNEKRIRYTLGQSLGDLAESIIRRDPLYSDIPIQHEVLSYLYVKYLEYHSEIDISYRQRILDMLVATARWKIENMLVRSRESFNVTYPQHFEMEHKFGDWIAQREGRTGHTVVSLPPSPSGKQKIDIVIKGIMKDRLPFLKHDRHICNPGQVCFSRSLLDTKVGIIVDKGTKRHFIDLMFCIDWPRSYFDIANFFAGSQSRFTYSSSDGVIAALNKALDLVEVLFPYFTDRVKEALEKNKSDSIEVN
jgi:hypothetical protein